MRKSKNQFAPVELKFIYKKAINPVKITNGNQAYVYFKSIWDKELINIQEQVYVLFLNQAKEVICWRCLHTGTMHEALIDIYHNHPSGYVKPSKADFKFTKDISDAAKLLGFSSVDHLVIGDNQYYSFLSNAEVGDCIEEDIAANRRRNNFPC